jgi:ACT domain-containing protein
LRICDAERLDQTAQFDVNNQHVHVPIVTGQQPKQTAQGVLEGHIARSNIETTVSSILSLLLVHFSKTNFNLALQDTKCKANNPISCLSKLDRMN